MAGSSTILMDQQKRKDMTKQSWLRVKAPASSSLPPCSPTPSLKDRQVSAQGQPQEGDRAKVKGTVSLLWEQNKGRNLGKADFERRALRRANAYNSQGDSQGFIPKTAGS